MSAQTARLEMANCSNVDDATSTAGTSGQAECYLIVYNVAKKHNIGTLARSGTAFNVTKVRAAARQDAESSRSCTINADLFGRITALQYLWKPWLRLPCCA